MNKNLLFREKYDIVKKMKKNHNQMAVLNVTS